MEKPQRLLGIDLIRGVAALGVAILHAGDDTNALNVDYWAQQLRDVCGAFVVPFFLITSFYLATNKLYLTDTAPSLKSRIQRLVIPYIFWSAFYLLTRTVKFLLLEAKGFEKISDIVSVVFFGSASVHLYFIPLLFVGTFLLTPAKVIISKKPKLTQLIFLLLFSILLHQLLIATGNAYLLGPNVAFNHLTSQLLINNRNPLIRIFFVFLAWLIKCLPYVSMAMLLSYVFNYAKLIKPTQKLLSISFVIFLILDLFARNYLPQAITEIAVSSSLLVFAICLSSGIVDSAVIKSLGACSFGIYLIHYFVIQVLRIPLGKLSPGLINQVSVPSQLLFASLSFSIAWLITYLVLKKKFVSRLMFGA